MRLLILQIHCILNTIQLHYRQLRTLIFTPNLILLSFSKSFLVFSLVFLICTQFAPSIRGISVFFYSHFLYIRLLNNLSKFIYLCLKGVQISHQRQQFQLFSSIFDKLIGTALSMWDRMERPNFNPELGSLFRAFDRSNLFHQSTEDILVQIASHVNRLYTERHYMFIV